jgi:hypothetical protein
MHCWTVLKFLAGSAVECEGILLWASASVGISLGMVVVLFTITWTKFNRKLLVDPRLVVVLVTVTIRHTTLRCVIARHIFDLYKIALQPWLLG